MTAGYTPKLSPAAVAGLLFTATCLAAALLAGREPPNELTARDPIGNVLTDIGG